jgi:hypothetical protein
MGSNVLVHVSVPLMAGGKQNGGFKVIAQVQGVTQDLFVSIKDSTVTKEVVEATFAAAGANLKRDHKSMDGSTNNLIPSILDNDSYPVIGKHK